MEKLLTLWRKIQNRTKNTCLTRTNFTKAYNETKEYGPYLPEVTKKLKQIWWSAEVLKEALDVQELHTKK